MIKPVYINQENRNGIGDTEVESMKEVDLSGLKLPMIAIFQNPDDDPEMCVARVFDQDIPTDIIMRRGCVDDLKREIRISNPDMVFLHRGAEDVPALVGVYV